jgi:hypothetical protein
MTRHAHPADFYRSGRPSTGPGLLTRLRRHLARLSEAWAGQARLVALGPETQRDTGLAPDDLTGAPSYDPALPFFFQASFGRHSR